MEKSQITIMEVLMLSKEMLVEFEKRCPETVAVRGILENCLTAEAVDKVFADHSKGQYTRKILFSSVVEAMGSVVFGLCKSVTLACKKHKERLGASTRALFTKMGRTEPGISAALVEEAYQRMAPIVDSLGSAHKPLFPGYATRIIDGNHLASTDHRLAPLRRIGGGALPGVAVVVLDRERELFHSVSISEDAYRQERVLGLDLIGNACAGEIWIGDRNFCTSANVWELHHVGAAFLFRRHKLNVSFRTVGKLKRVGKSDTGMVYQQAIMIRDNFGKEFAARLIQVRLVKPTRDGETVLELITNLPSRIGAVKIGDSYRGRWTVETSFAEVENLFNSEIPALSEPRAALLVFSLSLIAWSTIGVLKAGLRKVHGHQEVVETLSIYYLVDRITRNSHAIALLGDDIDWQAEYGNLTPRQMAARLTKLCQQIDLTDLRKNKRGPKKKTKRPKAPHRRPHFSTYRAINNVA
jgi:hypothetical protein